MSLYYPIRFDAGAPFERNRHPGGLVKSAGRAGFRSERAPAREGQRPESSQIIINVRPITNTNHLRLLGEP